MLYHCCSIKLEDSNVRSLVASRAKCYQICHCMLSHYCDHTVNNIDIRSDNVSRSLYWKSDRPMRSGKELDEDAYVYKSDSSCYLAVNRIALYSALLQWPILCVCFF